MYRLLASAGWAPAGVLLLNILVVRTAYRQDLNWLVHALGGAAMAYFLYRAAGLSERHLGWLSPLAQHLLAFGLTCAVAIAWECVEFAFGYQDGLTDTMGDLAFGMLGAALSLLALASRRLR
jgi:hypothetical protein